MKNKINTFFENIKIYLENNKKQIIINYIIFGALLFVLLLIDLLTKQFLFEWDSAGEGGSGNTLWESWFIGFRSIHNRGLTAFGGLLPIPLIHFLNFIIIFVCLGFLVFLKSPSFVVAVTFICAGTLGNMIDRFAFDFVRDIVFIPWISYNSTFNFADVDAGIGAIIAVVSLIVYIIKDAIKSRKNR